MKKLLAFLLCFLAVPAFAAAPIGTPIPSIQSGAAESSHVLKATPGLLNGFSASSGATSGYVMIFDATTAPSDGAVTPKFCYALPASQTTGASWVEYPVYFVNGIVIVFSSTGCFTKTASATAFFTAQVQ